MNKKIEDAIQESERILIGIGEEFSPQVPAWEGPDCLEAFYKNQYYSQLPENHEVLQAYRKLRELVGERPYFVVTLNTDDLIYRAGFEAEQVVAPCGSCGKLQCSEHIVDADEVSKQVMEQYRTQIAQEKELCLDGVDWEEGSKAERIMDAPCNEKKRISESEDFSKVQEEAAQKILRKFAVCPECGKPLVAHTIQMDGYLESGYLPQWEAYKKWLATTLNKKLCVLELGVGFQYPQVIRWPFERTAFYNKKAVFVRVHSKFQQIEAELADKAITVKESPVKLLLDAE